MISSSNITQDQMLTILAYQSLLKSVNIEGSGKGLLCFCHSVFVQRSFRHKCTVLATVSLTQSVGYIFGLARES
jgi:hypothetical protein